VNRSNQIAFVFGGQGPEWWGMGRELLEREPVFAARIRECDDALRRISRWSILDQFSITEVKSQIKRVDIAQAMLLAVHLGLAALWEEWGVVPDAVVGHAAGELSAACHAGAMTIDDAMRVIVARAAVMRRLAGSGLMVAVKANAETGAELIRGFEDCIAVGVVNGPQSIVLSGEGDAMIGLAHQLASQGIQHRVLHLPYAVYAPQMAAAATELGPALNDIRPVASRIPIVSTVTGHVIDGDRLDAAHWARNIADPVQFADALTTLFSRGSRLFVEIGPDLTLGRVIAECAAAAGHTVTVLPSLRRGQSERSTMGKSLTALNQAMAAPVDAAPPKRKEEKRANAVGRIADAARPARIVAIHSPSPSPTMYFIGEPGAGDEGSLRDIAGGLGPSFRSFALLGPAMSDGEPPIADIAQLAELFVDQVAAHEPNQPIALVGHSVWGAIAFETARRLEKRGAPVAGLVLLDAPLSPRAAATTDEVWDTTSFADHVARAKAAGWITPEIEPSFSRRDMAADVWARRERTWSASIDALRAYRPDGKFHGSAAFITPARPQDGLVESAARWRELCPTLELVTTPGNHLTMGRDPHAAQVAHSIRGLFESNLPH